MSYDSFSYDIRSRLPEWWKDDKLAESINLYTQDLIAQILQSLLSSTGVVQPLNVWKSIPEEYHWYHHYKNIDDYLSYETANKEKYINKPTCILYSGDKTIVRVPNTKRKCHAKIKLKLKGGELSQYLDENTGQRKIENKKHNIETLTLRNGNQYIHLYDIPNISTIEISTEDNRILVDGEENNYLTEGQFNKIEPTIKYSDYIEPYIDESEYYTVLIESTDFSEEIMGKEFYINKGITTTNQIFKVISEERKEIVFDIKINETYKKEWGFEYHCDFYLNKEKQGTGILKRLDDTPKKNIQRFRDIDIKNENKETFFTIESTSTINFEIEVYLLKPTYTTQQNIKISTVSAFPIERVDLFGYFCHPFNNKEGYEHIWSKTYEEEKRVVHDRITKQFDCERFYIKVKFFGIDTPLEKGFPQESLATNQAYQTNPMLDKWGKVYGLPRRMYEKKITEDDEPYTFPKYYPYEIEQDYWYEKRMINEYAFNDEAINSYFIKDSDLNNVASLECIYPFMHDIWVYTETIDPDDDTQHKLEVTGKDLCVIKEMDTNGVEWSNIDKLLANKPIDMITLNPYNNETQKLNDFSYQSKNLKLSFCLTPYKDEIPKDINITGIELVFKSKHDIQSNSVTLTSNSYILLPHSFNKEPDKIFINDEFHHWKRNAQYYVIGGETDLFQEKEITREQIFNNNDGHLDFEIGFINQSNYLEALLTIEEVSLNIYYEIVPDEYSIKAKFDSLTLIDGEKEDLLLDIILTNESDKEITNKEVYIIVPPEFELNSPGSYYFDLDTEEEKIVKIEGIKINPVKENNHLKTGLYDILVVCEDKIISNEILVRSQL